MNSFEIIRTVRLTEKGTKQGEAFNQYTVVADRRANKTQIRQAVQELFKVKVTKVNTLNVRGKFSVVPCPAGIGRLDQGLPLFGQKQLDSWLAMCREVIVPSYTFVATPGAALNAGYQPYFVDIDPRSLAISPERLFDHPMLPQAGAVIVVGPYGRLVPYGDWQEFTRLSGIPVVIDAAAGFDAVAADPENTIGDLPVMLSLHATKAFGVGEGGLILCRDAELLLRCGRALNFGFLDSREALVAGFNGKMSEYHAAVGLAALDAWPQTRAGFLAAAQAYRSAAQRSGLGGRIIAETGWASNYVLYRAETAAEAVAAQQSLAQANIDFRLWYGVGCHAHPAYAEFPRDPLPVTEDVAPRIIGLPVAVDLAEEAIEHTVAALARICSTHDTAEPPLQ